MKLVKIPHKPFCKKWSAVSIGRFTMHLSDILMTGSQPCMNISPPPQKKKCPLLLLVFDTCLITELSKDCLPYVHAVVNKIRLSPHA